MSGSISINSTRNATGCDLGGMAERYECDAKQPLSMPPGPAAGHQQAALLREGDANGVSGVCGEK
jgi:hypothetical protein